MASTQVNRRLGCNLRVGFSARAWNRPKASRSPAVTASAFGLPSSNQQATRPDRPKTPHLPDCRRARSGHPPLHGNTRTQWPAPAANAQNPERDHRRPRVQQRRVHHAQCEHRLHQHDRGRLRLLRPHDTASHAVTTRAIPVPPPSAWKPAASSYRWGLFAERDVRGPALPRSVGCSFCPRAHEFVCSPRRPPRPVPVHLHGRGADVQELTPGVNYDGPPPRARSCPIAGLLLAAQHRSTSTGAELT